jgi:hypothetical protein
MSGDGVRLTREPDDEEVERRDRARVELGDVAIRSVVREVVAVYGKRGAADLAEADARVVAQRELEPASAGESEK